MYSCKYFALKHHDFWDQLSAWISCDWRLPKLSALELWKSLPRGIVQDSMTGHLCRGAMIGTTIFWTVAKHCSSWWADEWSLLYGAVGHLGLPQYSSWMKFTVSSSLSVVALQIPKWAFVDHGLPLAILPREPATDLTGVSEGLFGYTKLNISPCRIEW